MYHHLLTGPPMRYICGLVLGFPECCVRSLCDGRSGPDLPEDVRQALRRQKPDGFVPCVGHGKQILNGVKVSTILGRKKNYSDRKVSELLDNFLAEFEEGGYFY